MTELPGADAARLSRRWLVLVLVAVLAVAALAGARQFAARSAATGSGPPAEGSVPAAEGLPAGTADTPAAADCEEEPPPESFTLAECDADGNPVEADEPAGTPGAP